MKRNVVIGGAAAFLAIVLAWFFVVYRPVGDELKTAQASTADEQHKTEGLQANLTRLEAQKKLATQQEALLRKFDQAIPKEPDLAAFIIQANKIAASSGIEFLSIAPSPPAASGTSSTINLTISVQGSFFQVENYLTKMENLERLVIIDGINLAAGASSAGSSSSDGVTLSVSITGRMFTKAAPAAAAGSAPVTPAPTTSSTTTPGGASSSTTAPTGSSTTGGA